MESKRPVPSGSPTAPPLHYYSSHPTDYPPPPPQYGTQGTGPPPQYGTQGTGPPPQYDIQGAGPPPQYGIQGAGTPLQYNIFIQGTGPPPQYDMQGTGPPPQVPLPQYGMQGIGPPPQVPPPQYGKQGTGPPPQVPPPRYGMQGTGPPPQVPPPQYGKQGTGPPPQVPPPQYGKQGTGPPPQVPPPQYGKQGTGLPPQVPPPQYGMQGTGPPPQVPPPQYGMQGTGPPPQMPPPQYGMQGTVPYESVSPPPPYSTAPTVSYNQGYPVTGIPGTQPPMQPGHGLYPTLSRLLVPPGAPAMDGSSSSLAPARPAPLPPNQTSTPLPAPRPGSQKCSFAHLKEGEAPQDYIVQWRGGEGLQIFFLQQEGHIVSPKKPLIMSIYKQISGIPGSVEGMVEVHGVWRLRLTGKNTPALHAMPDCYTFFDNSTCPSRMVVVQMSSQVTKKMSADLLDLLTQLTDLRSEEGGVVDKVTSGVATVYGDLTQKLNTAVKETVPSAHKSTKWLRKGTGSLVRFGGNLVSKGMHLVGDHIPVNDKPQQEESAMHTELLTALRKYKKALEENTVSYID